MAVGYGSDGTSIAANIGMPIDKAREMVVNLLKGMPGMAAYKKKTAKFLKENGYILINEITGHRVYWPEWASWKAEEDRYDKNFWEDYLLYHKNTDDEVAQQVRKHISQAHNWLEKNVLNYPIQGGSAIVLKQAAADLFKWVVEHEFFNKILFCVFVHDEIDVECPKENAEVVAKKITEIMKEASGRYYKRLPIPADANINSYWEH